MSSATTRGSSATTSERCVVVCYRRHTEFWIRNFSDFTSVGINKQGRSSPGFDVKSLSLGHLEATWVRYKKG